MKKYLAVKLAIAMVFSLCSFVIFADGALVDDYSAVYNASDNATILNEQDLSESLNILNIYMSAWEDLDTDVFCGTQIHQLYDTMEELHADVEAEFELARVNNEIKIVSFEIVDYTIIDATTIRYTVRFMQNCGAVFEGFRCTKKDNNEWFVYFSDDIMAMQMNFVYAPDEYLDMLPQKTEVKYSKNDMINLQDSADYASVERNNLQ